MRVSQNVAVQVARKIDTEKVLHVQVGQGDLLLQSRDLTLFCCYCRCCCCCLVLFCAVNVVFVVRGRPRLASANDGAKESRNAAVGWRGSAAATAVMDLTVTMVVQVFLFPSSLSAPSTLLSNVGMRARNTPTNTSDVVVARTRRGRPRRESARKRRERRHGLNDDPSSTHHHTRCGSRSSFDCGNRWSNCFRAIMIVTAKLMRSTSPQQPCILRVLNN
jgi:hypothetical protein